MNVKKPIHEEEGIANANKYYFQISVSMTYLIINFKYAIYKSISKDDHNAPHKLLHIWHGITLRAIYIWNKTTFLNSKRTTEFIVPLNGFPARIVSSTSVIVFAAQC